MTGRIPKYGAHFKQVGLPYHATLSSTTYVLKIDNNWFIRSDKTSKRWYIFHGKNRDHAINMGKVQPTLGEAMRLMLDGIDQGFYIIDDNRAGTKFGDWMDERPSDER
jgi:hypothetical protein